MPRRWLQVKSQKIPIDPTATRSKSCSSRNSAPTNDYSSSINPESSTAKVGKRTNHHLENPSLPRAKRPQQEKNSGFICQACQDIDFSYVMGLSAVELQADIDAGVFIQDLGSRICNPTENSCPLCSLFWSARSHAKGFKDVTSYQLRAYSTFTRFNNLRGSACPAEIRVKDLPYLAVIPTLQRKGSIPESDLRFLFCKSSAGTSDCVLVPEPRSTYIDFDKVSHLFLACQKEHTLLCRLAKHTEGETTQGPKRPLVKRSFRASRTWLEREDSPVENNTPEDEDDDREQENTVVRRMKLIDCSKSAFTPTDLKDSLVLAEVGMQYFALSYVWGKSRLCSATCPNSTKLPQVILDAMKVTTKLGCQYLWVDNYCIDQCNHAEKNYQMSKMELIYRGAELTIVAAAGQDAHYGLPGVENTPRISQQHLTIDDITIFLQDPTPKSVIGDSTWATRAWTFQEGRLARRLLVFTDYEVYFECESMYCRESQKWQFNLLYSHNRFRKFLDAGLFSKSGLGTYTSKVSRSTAQNFERYCSLVKEYTKKEFSSYYGHDDSLRAFSGLITYFEGSKYFISQLHGLPFSPLKNGQTEALSSFNASMLWRHVKGRLIDSRTHRRPNFPSWSWAGWGGTAIEFPFQTMVARRHFIPMIGNIGLKTCQHAKKITEFISLSDPPTNVAHEQVAGENALPTKEGLVTASNLSGEKRPSTEEPRILCFNAPSLSQQDLDFPIGIKKKKGDSATSPVFQMGRFRAVLYLSYGPTRQNHFEDVFSSGKLGWVLLGATTPFGRNKAYLHFMAIEPQGDAFTRVGILIVRATLDEFQREFVLERREIMLL